MSVKRFRDKLISVEWKYNFNDEVKQNFSNKEWAEKVQHVVSQVILPKIDKGVSPVHGERTFQKYKNPKQYPGDRKQNNKPNLTLTGEMLSHYTAEPTNKLMEIKVGMPDNLPKKEVVKVKANNEGTQSRVVNAVTRRTENRKLKARIKQASKGIPARPFIPLESKKQTFTKDIILAIRNYFAYALEKAIKKGEKK